jgi:hypothetical protein
MCGVVAFFIQGWEGVHPMDDQQPALTRKLRDELHWLPMIDEVQCGMGRTGKMVRTMVGTFSRRRWPRVWVHAPIGAVVLDLKAAHIFVRLATTAPPFGGNPFTACWRGNHPSWRRRPDRQCGAHRSVCVQPSRVNWAACPVWRNSSWVTLGIDIDPLRRTGRRLPPPISVTADSVIRLVPPTHHDGGPKQTSTSQP